LFDLGGLTQTLLFKLPAKFDSLLRGLCLGVAARVIGLGASLLCGRQLVILRAGEI
jgi:hypothetical protein